MTKDEPGGGTWGILLENDGKVHFFRKRRLIHRVVKRTESGIEKMAEKDTRPWMFMPRPGWDPSDSRTCPHCRRLLELEKERSL